MEGGGIADCRRQIAEWGEEPLKNAESTLKNKEVGNGVRVVIVTASGIS